jgi:diadenylate cyclase
VGELIQTIGDTFSYLDWRSIFDILLIAFIFYWLLLLVRGTTAMALLRGIVILLLFGFILSNVFQLTVLGWLLRNSFAALLIAVPILFQPELRRVLEKVGRAGFRGLISPPILDSSVDVLSKAAVQLSQQRHGALMVLERETGLQEYIDTGIQVDATISIELVLGVFLPKSPLHDGAVIIRGNRVIAAGCVLPLSVIPKLGSDLGTRHRAAIGITEGTDAISVVVSEETGSISVASNGRIVRHLDEARLHRLLTNLGSVSSAQALALWRKNRQRVQQ